MADRVGSEGSVNAPIVLIGEAPGHWEMEYGRPFVGPSYKDKLLPWWDACVPRLTREMFFITNVLDYQPHSIESVSESEIRAAIDGLHARLATLEGPDGGGPILIVPTGNYALYALTGKGRVSFHSRDGRWPRPGISEFRGSILEYEDRRGRRIKVIPTIHPAATMEFRSPGRSWVCQADWQRIATDVAFRELRHPPMTKIISPSKGEVIEWIRWTRGVAEQRKSWPANGDVHTGRIALSLDVETPKRTEYATKHVESVAKNAKCATCTHTKRWHGETGTECTKKALKREGGRQCGCIAFVAPMGKPKRIKVSEEAYLGCIGYSWDPQQALCVPTTLGYWHEPAILAQILEELRLLHADPNVDIFGQNFAFDAWWCAIEKLPIRNFRWDTMKMHRVRMPFSEWHDLAFQGSLYTRIPYWKDEAKDPDSVQRFAHNAEALWDYNCIDNIVQRMLLSSHITALDAMGRLEYYDELEAPMDPPLVDLSLRGIRVDLEGRATEREAKRAEAVALGKEINAAAEMKIVAKIAVSPAQMKVFLYEKLGLPPQYKKDTKTKRKTVSTDIVCILRLMERFPGLEQLQTVGRMVLKHRRMCKIAGFLKDSHVSEDGRQRAFFRQDTLLGRLSSGTPPSGRGAGLQNQDRKLRKFFLPDRGDES